MLLLVGDGVERKNLENLVHKLNISSITQFTGYKSETGAYHEMMDVCVFPFENEAFGLVVLESWQLGKPVIIFEDGGGMKEIMGAEFSEDIIVSLLELFERMNFYYEKGISISEAAQLRKKIAAAYSIEAMNKSYLKCYEAIL